MNSTTIHGHRGARGLVAENSLTGFRLAIRMGVSALELDVNVTSDHHIVVYHDSRLNRSITRDQTGKWLDEDGPGIYTIPLAKLKSFYIGQTKPGSIENLKFPKQQKSNNERIPTLAEVTHLLKNLKTDEVLLHIEIKCDPYFPHESPSPPIFAELLLHELAACELLLRTRVQSFNWHVLREIQRLDPNLPTGYLTSQQPKFDTIGISSKRISPWLAGFDPNLFGGSIPNTIKAAGGSYWGPNFADLSESLVHEAHKLGLCICAWTVNNTSDIQRLQQWGVDYITTDYPDIAQTALKRDH